MKIPSERTKRAHKASESRPARSRVSQPRTRHFLLLLTGILVVWGASWILIVQFEDNAEKRGTFGDMFGAVNALFSGGAFAGVIFAILLQQQELRLQRKELMLTRRELQRTAEAQESSETALAAQARALQATAQFNAVSLLPSVLCELRDNAGETVVMLSNVGSTPAFDLDIMAIQIVRDEDCDLDTFYAKYVKKHPPRRPTPTHDGEYGVYDRLLYPVLPQRRRRTVDLQFPLDPTYTYVFIQYRDVAGTNYAQAVFAYPDGDIRFRTAVTLPVVPTSTPRVELLGSAITEDGDHPELPEFLEEFLALFRASIPSGFTENSHPGPEDRGEWGDV